VFTTHTSIRELASHTQSALKLKKIHFKYCFPYSRYDSEQLYWLSNGAQPAYPHKKIFFQHSKHGFNIGLHVEKGFETDLAKKKECLTKQWDWHTFTQQLKKGELEKFCSKLGEKQGVLQIVVSPMQGKENDSVEFSLNPFICQQKLSKRNILYHFQNVQSGSELVNALENISSREFYWIDIWLKVPVLIKEVEEANQSHNSVDEEFIDTLKQMTFLS
jgi:hypothetical protein